MRWLPKSVFCGCSPHGVGQSVLMVHKLRRSLSLGQSFSPLGCPSSGSMRTSLSSSTTARQPHRDRHCAQYEGVFVILVATEKSPYKFTHRHDEKNDASIFLFVLYRALRSLGWLIRGHRPPPFLCQHRSQSTESCTTQLYRLPARQRTLERLALVSDPFSIDWEVTVQGQVRGQDQRY